MDPVSQFGRVHCYRLYQSRCNDDPYDKMASLFVSHLQRVVISSGISENNCKITRIKYVLNYQKVSYFIYSYRRKYITYKKI